MNIKIRRVILSSFFLLFFILAPLLILYTAGYRYDFKRGKVLRTGNIFIEAPDIRNATIFINNKPYKEPLSKKIYVKNLLPDEYTVRIEKDGRSSWENKVKVLPKLTTFIKNIILFLQTKPERIIQGNIENLYISPDQSTIAYTRIDEGFREIYLYSIEDNSSDLIYRVSETEDLKIIWAPSSNKILVYTKKSPVIINARGPYVITTFKNLPKIYNEIVWDVSSDNFFYVISNHLITAVNTATQESSNIYTTTNIISGNIFAHANSLYIVELANNTAKLILYNTNVNDSILISKLPSSTYYRFIEYSKEYITLRDTNLNKIFLIHKPSNQNDRYDFSDNVVQFDAHSAFFSPDKSKILLYNDFELSYFDLNSKSLNLINRFSKPIKASLWYSDSAHLILYIDGSLQITELQSLADKPQSIELLNNDTLSSLTLANGNMFYFIGLIDGNNGIYSLRTK